MSMILYYSNFCDKCKTLLQHISKSSAKKEMHFVCIDKRIKRENGSTYIILENGQEILLPPTVNKVPALLLLNRGHQVLFGNDINKYIEPAHVVSQQAATKNNGEPLAFSLSSGGYGGVVSDNYSFLDQESSELSAKGNGGLRQLHHYATINSNDCIETPPDNYSADTIGNVSMEQLQQKRNNDIMNINKR
jgi:hypothetical protein